MSRSSALDRPAFGRALTQLREEEGLSQEALAARLGIRQVHISLWETGTRTPTPARIEQLGVALGDGAATLLSAALHRDRR